MGVLGVNSMSNVAAVTKTLYEKHMLGLSEIKEANANMLYLARSYRNARFDRQGQGVERTAS